MTEHNVSTTAPSAKTLGGPTAFLLFLVALAAFVFQSSFTQYVQGDLGFRQPYFLMYIAHTSFIIIFPIHLLFLKVLTGRTYLPSLRNTITARLSSPSDDDNTPFPLCRFIVLILIFTAGINFPSTLWYASVSLASISDVTAIWNTNSFWVYVLCVWLYRMKWEARKFGAVLLACFGVMLDVYGGSINDKKNKLSERNEGPTAPVLGEILTLVGSITYALYQVMYKRYVALPEDPEASHEPFEYQSIPDPEDEIPSNTMQRPEVVKEAHYVPFGLYPNLFTSCLGLCNALVMLAGFPILHWLSIEEFRLPPDSITFWSIVGIAVGGILFNSCFMILLSIWGPILTSVGNLLTIALVLITDLLFTHSGVTMWSILGATMIVSAFAVLAFDMVQGK